MILRYLTLVKYPSGFANRLQVMKASCAFAQNSDFRLFVAEMGDSCRSLFLRYNIRFPFRVESIAKTMMWPRSFWLAKKYLPIIADEDQKTIWYVRNVLLTFWLTFLSVRFRRRYFFELHSLTRFPKWMHRRVLLNSLGIITTNKRKKKDIVDMFNISPDSVLVAGNGIDIEEFNLLPGREKARQKLDLAIQKPLVVYTGTVARAYGSEIIRQACDMLKREAEFIMVSGKSRNEALMHMMAADILVAPYLDADDHFRIYMSPMKIKEYMAAGRPVVISDLPSIREILDDSTVFFVPPGDARALAEKIRYIIANKSEAQQKAGLARKKALEYTWERRAARILDFMNKQLSSR